MKRISLTGWIFIGMVAGLAIGAFAPSIGKELSPISNIFLRLIKSIIAPLLFGTLVHGIASTGDIKSMGRIGFKAIVYFEVVTTIALFLGLGSVNLIRPGEGMQVELKTDINAPKADTSIGHILEHTFPSSLIDSMAKGEVLQIVVFMFIFGAACVLVGAKAKPVVDFADSLAHVMFAYTKLVMYFAPFGVAAAMAVTISQSGLSVLVNLGKLVLTLYGAQVLFVSCVLLPIAFFVGLPIRRFIRYVKEPFIIAFSTATSEAALPLALENMEEFGVPEHIVAFVLPTGYSFNLDGTTLYLSLASVFIAQAAGVQLSFGQQLLMMLTLMLTSKGVAGVPRASMVILSGTLATFNLPVAGIALLLGVDAMMDMARTSVNVLGNCLASAVIARWEGVKINANGPVEPETADVAIAG